MSGLMERSGAAHRVGLNSAACLTKQLSNK